MFCARKGKVMLAEAGCVLSHYDWFRRERWIVEADAAENFFRSAVSGWYVPDEDALYCFREMTFGPDPQLIAMLVDHLPPLTKQLGVSPATKVFIGPRDDESRGFVIRRHYSGTVGEIVKREGD